MFASIPPPYGGSIIEWGSGSRAIGKTGNPSDDARRRILSVRGNPLFVCDWQRTVFVHYEVEPDVLQHEVPFELDLHEGRAYLSLVAFTMRGMRPRWGGRAVAAMLFKPIASHGFLNVRAYVKHGGETGIYFLAEWLPNRLSLLLGPGVFHVLPRGFAGIPARARARKVVRLGHSQEFAAPGIFCEWINPEGSLDEFLLERYSAFTAHGSRRRKFHIWHPPWPQRAIDIDIKDDELLRQTRPWFQNSRLACANNTPGIRDVWMGRPQGL